MFYLYGNERLIKDYIFLFGNKNIKGIITDNQKIDVGSEYEYLNIGSLKNNTNKYKVIICLEKNVENLDNNTHQDLLA